MNKKLFLQSIPLPMKMAISIGTMLTVIMTLQGLVLVQYQTNLLATQFSNHATTLVQTHAASLQDLITQAQMRENKEDIHASKVKADPMAKQNLLLTLKVISTQLTKNKEIMGAAIYSVRRKELSKSGSNPFDQSEPYAGKETRYLTDQSLLALKWHTNKTEENKRKLISFISPVYLQQTVVGYVMITLRHEQFKQVIAVTVQIIITATLIMLLLSILLLSILGRNPANFSQK